MRFCNPWGELQESFVSGGPFRVPIRYTAHTLIRTPTFGVAIYNARGDNLTGPNSVDYGFEIEGIQGDGEISYIIDALPLQPGAYTFTAAIYDRNSVHPFDHHHRALHLHGDPGASYPADGRGAGDPVPLGTPPKFLTTTGSTPR